LNLRLRFPNSLGCFGSKGVRCLWVEKETTVGVKNLPLDSGKRITKVFEACGWVAHYGKNHYVLTHPERSPTLIISIPDHRQVSRTLLKTELRKAEISEERFCSIYEEL
jgi:hypothetical protein